MIRRHTLLLAACIFLMLGYTASLRSAPAPTPLTNAADVLALSADQAKSGVPVSVTGVVTAAQTNWDGRFFMQDASGGVFVENKNTTNFPAPGDRVNVTGISHPGGYAPIITKPHWNKLGTALQPEAKPVTIDRLMSGAEDSQRVEITGIVRAAQMIGQEVGLDLVSGGFRIHIYGPLAPEISPPSLVGAKVRVRGTAAATFYAQLRHIATVTLYMPQAADLFILEAAPANPFAGEVIPLNGIAQYRKDRPPGNQVHVKGIVTFQRRGVDLFLQDARGGLQVKSKMTNSVAPGEEVEAVGFPAVENYLPVLEDAEFRKTGGPRIPLTPHESVVTNFQRGLYHGDFITVKARVLDHLTKGIDSIAGQLTPRTILLLQTATNFFTAEANSSAPNDFLDSIPAGSLVQASGICLLESDETGAIKSFRMLLPDQPDIRILEAPGWLTTRHLLISLMVVFAVLLIAIIRTARVSKNNLILKSLVREKEAAQEALQQAHDLLEERVQERTNQLKIEMTARKESELQFRATLTERTRLAQELHDTLEQTMTGIALQLDMVASLFAKNPDDASLHLKLARNLMRQSQLDVRQSVWGLRSRATEQFNLTNAVLINSRQIAGGAGVQIQVSTVGESRPLSEIVEENLMRISQEAITNVVKHSGANLVKITLNFGADNIVLEIEDNGRGFNPANCAGPQEGHFGLLGISERTERLGGQVQITSIEGKGTAIRVAIPVKTLLLPQAVLAAEKLHEERP